MNIQIEKFLQSLTTKKVIIFLIILGYLLYFNSFFNGFVADDYAQILDNTFVHSITNIPLFFRSSTFQVASNTVGGTYYKPLMTTIFSLIYSLFGPNAFVFHFIQVSVHIVNSILVFLVLKHFFKKEISIFLSTMFLIHPINSEAVLYISSLQDVLFFLFGMFALYLATIKKFRATNLLISFFLVLSLLSKETGVLFIFILPAYLFFFKKEQFRRTLIYVGLILIAYIILHNSVVGFGFINHPLSIGRLSLSERLINIPAIVFFYFKTFFFPKDLAIIYQWKIKSTDFSSFYLPLLFIIVLLTYLIRKALSLYKTDKQNFVLWLFFLIWVILGVGFHLQIIPLGDTVAERWFYFPMVGFLGLIAIILQSITYQNEKLKISLLLVALALIIVLSARTFIRIYDWRSGLSLAEHDIQVSKDSPALENNLGAELFYKGSYNEAIIHLKRSTELDPLAWSNWDSLGTSLIRKAEVDKDKTLLNEAESNLQKAVNNSGVVDSPYVNLGYLYINYRDSKTANIFLQNSLKKFPQNYKLWYFLTLNEYELGNKSNAIIAAQNAYQLNSSDSTLESLYHNLVNNNPINITKPKF